MAVDLKVLTKLKLIFQFEKSAQLITIWWGLTTKKDNEASDFRSNVIYTHLKFLHPSLVLSSNKITLQGNKGLFD